MGWPSASSRQTPTSRSKTLVDNAYISLCLSVVALAVVIAWPIWDLSASLASVAGRVDRARVASRVKHYAKLKDHDEEHLWGLIADMVEAAATQGIVMGDTEGFWAIKAALAISKGLSVPVAEAIRYVAAEL